MSRLFPITVDDGEPRFLVEVTVPQGALSDRRKAGLAAEATGVILQAAGLRPDEAMRVWVLINEQTEGTWAGGGIIRYADAVTAAQSERAGA
jgi:phenylpyruvate tautomerase PptA (4-oxalocrotonate tautomerase family)